jgi:hypothetical protein
MPRYIISYDGSRKDTDYDALEKRLEDIEAKRIQHSLWGLRSNDTIDEIFEKIWPFLGNAENSLLVVPAGEGREKKSIALWEDI